jgi:hypothetical protein
LASSFDGFEVGGGDGGEFFDSVVPIRSAFEVAALFCDGGHGEEADGDRAVVVGVVGEDLSIGDFGVGEIAFGGLGGKADDGLCGGDSEFWGGAEEPVDFALPEE